LIASEAAKQRRRATGYIAEIDGLRAIAVLLVLIHHLKAGLLDGGFIGVDIFFVISGYVVSKSLTATPMQGVGRYLSRFYARRITRILPALLVCLVVTSIATVLFIPESWLSSSIPTTGLWAFVGAANMALMNTNDGYFAPRAEFNPFTQTWSLGVEEQFYLLFPWVFLLWLGFRWNPRKRLLFLAWGVLGVLTAASFITAARFSMVEPDRAFYSVLSRFWQMGAGSLLFLWHDRLADGSAGDAAPSGRARAEALLLSGFALIAVAVLICRPAQVPFPLGLVPVAGTLMVLHATGREAASGLVLARWLASAPARWLGRRSYSLYLWHWPVIMLMRWTVGLERWTLMLLAVVISLTLALISFHLIENPFRHSGMLKGISNRVKIGAGLLAVTISMVGSNWLFSHRSDLSLSVTGQRYDWYPLEESSGSSGESTNHKPLQGRTIFVVGNSHAGAYIPLLKKTSQELGLRTVISNQGKCAMGLLIEPVRERTGCLEVEQAFLRQLQQEAKPGDLVFLASLRLPRFTDQWTTSLTEAELLQQQQSPKAKQLRQLGLHETAALIASLRALGLQVMVDRPKPIFRAVAFRCSDWFNRGNPACAPGFSVDRSFVEELSQPVLAQMRYLQKATPELVVWDPLPVLCPQTSCEVFRQGRPLFFDADHLSGYGNRLLYASFVETLKKVWPELDQSERMATPAAGSIKRNG
jgi:peptidoglycan/LPS O-acetylase OafA/YrhL